MENMPIIPMYSADEQKRADERKVRREEKYASDVESTGELISTILKTQDEYVETYKLSVENEIDKGALIADNAGRNVLEMIKGADLSVSGLSGISIELMNRFPNIKFSFSVDGKAVILKFENKIKADSLVHWVSQGTNQWEEPRKIVSLSDDRQYAFVEGSQTGIPVSQLEVAA